MQEAKKKIILIASVLKPADEPRAFEKMGRSLSLAEYKIFIAGCSPSSKQTVDNITFFPHEKVGRISIARIKARFKILRYALKLKPDLFILSTHELLGIGLIYRLLTRRKIIYDVQENYFKNILYTNAFPKFPRLLIASLVRFKEMVSSLFISGSILAENCYEQELNFVERNYCIVENKCKVPEGFQRMADPDSLKLLFTGTLAESTGIFEAIRLAKQLHALDSKINLEIVGFCPLLSVLEKIKNEIQSCSFISLKGGDYFVSHEEIFNAIASANFGIISYPVREHTKNRIPTKLYEYLACGLPIVLQKNPVWEKVAPASATIAIDFDNYDSKQILEQLRRCPSFMPAFESRWESEEKKLVPFINTFLA